MAVSSIAQRQLSDGNTQGTVLGQSSSDVIGFYGVTTCVSRVAVGGSVSSGALTSSVIAQLNAMGLINVTTFGA